MHAAICDFIADCLQNSIEAGSSRINLLYDSSGSAIKTIIEDNGKGMSKEQLEKVRDPFYTDGTKHLKRKIGLGIPFLLQAVNLSGGAFSLESEKGKGTRLEFTFDPANIDTPPEGDIATTVLQAMMFDGDYELEFKRSLKPVGSAGGRDFYTIKRSELLEILGDLSTAETINLAKQYFISQEENLNKETGNG
ncbi:MAG: sensor histidine kinase [Spirochaetia bacterium]|jgi:hypothetical protein|nr:sensor histidine kinase [Spirochaetia bacterium]